MQINYRWNTSLEYDSVQSFVLLELEVSIGGYEYKNNAKIKLCTSKSKLHLKLLNLCR